MRKEGLENSTFALYIADSSAIPSDLETSPLSPNGFISLKPFLITEKTLVYG